MKSCRAKVFLVFTILFVFFFSNIAFSQEPPIPIPKISIGIGTATSPKDVALTLEILLLLTVLSLAPAILMMVTSFTRIIIVLSFIRHALGTQQMPSNQILIGLALFLTFFTMYPVGKAVTQDALMPYLNGKISFNEAISKGEKPIREFMIRQTREKDLALFVSVAKLPRPKNINDVPTYVLIPAFMISELKTAFEMGFLIYIPFLVIDIVTASVLMSMGMMMVPPVMISLPFKILLFVMVDGWHLLVRSIILSFR